MSLSQNDPLPHQSISLDPAWRAATVGVYSFATSAVGSGLVASEAFKQRLGFVGHDVIPMDLFLERVDPESRAQVAAFLSGGEDGPTEFDLAIRLTEAKGTQHAFLLRGLHVAPQRVSGVLVEQADIAARPFHFADASHPQSTQFAAMADAMPQMVWSSRPDGFHDYYNVGWYEFTGVPAGSTDGEAWNVLFHPDDQERAWQCWLHALATEEPYQNEYRLRHHSGEYRWVLGRARTVRDDAGRIVRWIGTCTDINDTKKAAELVELLSQELSHRIKNIFAIIQSLVGLSARRAPESAGFARDLQARIAALGRAHDLARPHSDQSRPHYGRVTLNSLAREILRPYLAMDDGRISIRGQDVSVDDAAATPLALILHELATNAKKYGALSTPSGRVDLEITCDDSRCHLLWTETGGPDVTGKPATTGFGTKLMIASAQSHLNGQIEWSWEKNGVVVSFICPRKNLVRAA